jgi:uncharacterized protein
MYNFKIVACILISSFIFGFGSLCAQTPTTNPTNTLHLSTLIADEGVILRWGPSDATIWHNAHSTGYRLQRAKVPVNSNELENYKYDTLSKEIFKPLPKEDWETIIDADAYVSSAWASLYEIRPDVSGDVAARLSNQEDIQQKAFFLAMVAADHSAVAADALGLRYLDKTVEKGSAYIYRITLAGDDSSEALSYVDLSTALSVSKPQTLETISEEKAVLLKWMVSLDNNKYTSYHVERSDNMDGPFKRLTKVPYLHLAITDGSEVETPAFYKDSVDYNYKPYYYRLIGITPFATESNPSEVTVGMARDFTPPEQAVQVTAIADKNNHVVITWTKTMIEDDFAGFVVGRAESYEGPFEPIHNGMLESGLRTFKHVSPNINTYNYYVVSVVDTAGNIAVSESAFAFFRDTIPPPIPVGLTGSIDTTGLVTIRWRSVSDPTLIGYRVYFSNSPNHTFIMRDGDLITDTVYQERITLKTLSEKILYSVASVDNGYGHSDYSEVLELKKPDIIPPTSGVFKSHQLDGTSISLQWEVSSSHDLVSQQLWRKESNEEWELIKVFDSKTSTYADVNLGFKRTYTYGLKAVDDDGLISKMSSPITISTLEFEDIESVKDLRAEIVGSGNKVVLLWDYHQPKGHSFIVYKAVGNSNPESYDFIEDDTQFSDLNVLPDNTYQYWIKVKDSLGNESRLSDPIAVTIPKMNK